MAEATKNTDGERRSDLAPLTTRLPALGTPVAATWYSGTSGDPDVPGPSTYWIDAVIELSPAVDAQLRALAVEPATSEPDVVDSLRDVVPHGLFLVGRDLDAFVSDDGWAVTAWLAEDRATLVIAVVGQ